jgi:glycosyltransferase involved in cell wall biosynthesis
MPEVQIHGKTGFLSEVGDYQDMAKNALLVLTDNSLSSAFSKACIKQANAFRLDIILPQYEAIYQRVLLEAGPSF